jgi:hypothetical protein
MLKVSLLASVLLSTASITPLPTHAGFVAPYDTSYLYSGTLDGCLKGGKGALEKHGYVVDEVVSFREGKAAVIYASHSSLALGATIECDPSNGKGALAVAGPNDKDAFESFRKLSEEAW